MPSCEKCWRDDEIVQEFQTASGLITDAGDPADVTPEMVADYVCKMVKVVELVEAGLDKSHPDMAAALAALPKKDED